MRAITFRADSFAKPLGHMLAGLFGASLICLPLTGAEPDTAQTVDESSPPPAVAAKDSTPPSPALTTIVLGSAEPYMAIGGSQGRLLPRELARQAALIAARDELGLNTRDATLRESESQDSPVAKRIDVQTADFRGKRLKVQLIDPSRKSSRSILDHEIPLPLPATDRYDYVGLVVATEELARTKMPESLRNAGFAGQPNKIDLSVQVPAEVEKRLSELNAFSQFAALRALHALQREKGESTATLGAISRAYANLGQLTQHQWNATHKAFKARALLYAQRLLVREPENPAGRWHRAYALALTGLHQSALDDFEAARGMKVVANADHAATPDSKPQESPAANDIPSPAPSTAPYWAQFAELHCHFDDDALLKAAKEGPKEQSELAWFLTYISVEHDDLGPAYALTTGRQAFAGAPDCLRIIDSMCDFKGVSNLHYTTTTGPQSLVKSINRRVRSIPGLPADVVAFIKQMRTARIRNEPGEAWNRDICPLFEMHPELIERLDKAADPASEKGEPSWSILARLIEEPTFMQLYRRVRFLHDSLGTPVDEMVKYAGPLVAHHPYHAFIDSSAVDYSREPDKYWAYFKYLDMQDVEMHSMILMRAAWMSPHKARIQGHKAWQKSYDHMDETNHEYEIQLNNGDDYARSQHAKFLAVISPHNPLVAATLIRCDWKESGEKQAEKWDAEFAQQPLVTGALARQYGKLKRIDDAKSAFKRYIAKSPDQWAYVDLADLYLDEGNVEQWNATLDEFLGHEDFALSHASVRVRIANYYMGQKDFEKAKPYAEAAAGSGAAWAMLCAAECLEGLGDFRAAEEYIAQNAGRYARQEPTWFFWCKRTGHGDVEQATAMANEYFAKIAPRATPEDYLTMGVFYLLTNKELAARNAFQKAFRSKPEPFLSLHEALLANAQGETAARDAALQKAIDTPVPESDMKDFNQASIELAKLFQKALAGGEDSALTREKLDPILDTVKKNGPGTIAYFTARFLDAHGDKELARSYWERCAAQKLSLTHILGIEHLRSAGG